MEFHARVQAHLAEAQEAARLEDPVSRGAFLVKQWRESPVSSSLPKCTPAQMHLLYISFRCQDLMSGTLASNFLRAQLSL